MRIKAERILLGINVLTFVLILIVSFLPNNVLRIILGLPFVLFFPGYTLLAALFPRGGSLDGVERLVFSFGMSIAVVPLTGLALNVTPWGIRLYPMLISLFIFIVFMSAISWYRGRRLLPEERIALTFETKLPSISNLWSIQTSRSKIVTIVLVLLIIGALGTLGYVISIPKVQDNFTEFYVLNAEGKASNYPSMVVLGQSTEVILGIVNQEHEPTIYKIEIHIDGENAGEIGAINLNDGEKWEQIVTFSPNKTGSNQKVEFLLYTGIATDASEKLAIWVNVSGRP